MKLLRLSLLCSLVLTASAATFDLADGTLAYVAGSGAVPLDADASLADSDFSSGSPLSLSMSITSGLVAGEDLLQIRAVGAVSVSSGVVSVSGTPIGAYSGGGGGTPLSITITPGSSSAHIQTLVRALAYHNLAGSGASTTNRVIRITVTDQDGPVNDQRTVAVGVGNAAPALTIGGTLIVPRSSRMAIEASVLLATDDDDDPEELRYQLGTLPSHGNLLLMSYDADGDFTGSVVLGGSSIEFTQEDVDAGRLRYDHQGGTQTSDSFTLRVRDSAGAATPLTALSITITGTLTDPTIILPAGALTCTEQGPAVAMDPAAPAPIEVVINDGDSPHYRRGQLVVSLVDADGADAGTTGDTISIRAANGQTPVMSQTGYICVFDTSIYVRHAASGVQLPSAYDSALDQNDSPDQLLGTIDTTDDGVAGRPLRITLASTVVWQSTGNGTDGDILDGETEIVTPAAVAQLLANLQLSHPGDAPPAGPRFIKVTLTEATPNTASGTAQRAIDVVPVNDPPQFTVAGPLAMSSVVGRPMIVTLLANDPDLPSGASLTYSLKNAPVAGLTLDPASGAVTWVPGNTAPANLELVAVDEVAAESPSLFLTITPLAGPTADAPYVVTDPLVELGEGELIFHPFTIGLPAAGGQVVDVQVVGDAPPGYDVESVSVDDLSWALTAPTVSRPADGIYTFGLRVEVDTGTGSEIGYQPITVVVVGVAGSN
jgi:hypothetical protein